MNERKRKTTRSPNTCAGHAYMSRRRTLQSGQAAVELVAGLPIFVFVIGMILYYASYYYTHLAVITTAADCAVMMAESYGGGDYVGNGSSTADDTRTAYGLDPGGLIGRTYGASQDPIDLAPGLPAPSVNYGSTGCRVFIPDDNLDGYTSGEDLPEASEIDFDPADRDPGDGDSEWWGTPHYDEQAIDYEFLFRPQCHKSAWEGDAVAVGDGDAAMIAPGCLP